MTSDISKKNKSKKQELQELAELQQPLPVLKEELPDATPATRGWTLHSHGPVAYGSATNVCPPVREGPLDHGPYLALTVPVPPKASGWWFINGATMYRSGTVRWIIVSSMCQWSLFHVRNSSRMGRAWTVQRTAIVLLWSNCELAMYGTAVAVPGPWLTSVR